MLSLLLLLLGASVQAWQQWKYLPPQKENALQITGRRGHSLAYLYTYKQDGLKRYEQQKVILFGGRQEDTTAPHNPKTYRIEEVNGTLEFGTYEHKTIRNDMVPKGVYLNDVWQVNCIACLALISDLCDSCTTVRHGLPSVG
jgi:hypothetical protein